jgi:hypothetical protein
MSEYDSLDEQVLQETVNDPPEYQHPDGDELLALFEEYERTIPDE